LAMLDTDVLVGLAASTAPAADKLPHRAAMLEAIKSRLARIAPERAPGIVKHLR
jgi:hypothetical protein